MSPTTFRVRVAAFVLAAGWSLVILAESGAGAQDNPPTGGGMGCQSQGNCSGTLYKDKSNLDKWWYEVCSGCHVVQAPRPLDATTTRTRFQQDLVSSRQRFDTFHADAAADPVLRQLTPKSRMRPPATVRSPYKELLVR